MLKALAGDVQTQDDGDQGDQNFFHAGKLKPIS